MGPDKVAWTGSTGRRHWSSVEVARPFDSARLLQDDAYRVATFEWALQKVKSAADVAARVKV